MIKKNHSKKIMHFWLPVVLVLSLVLNAYFCMRYDIFVELIQKAKSFKILQNSDGTDYLNNPQYNARLTTFNLYSEEADIIFVGDSITQNVSWDELFPDYNCLNRGIGSDTTEGLMNRVDEIMLHQPGKIFILIGINDLSTGVSPERAADNMRDIISQIYNSSADCQIYIESVLYAEGVDNAEVDSLNSYYKIICDEYDIAKYIDIQDSMDNLGGCIAV